MMEATGWGSRGAELHQQSQAKKGSKAGVGTKGAIGATHEFSSELLRVHQEGQWLLPPTPGGQALELRVKDGE